MLRQMIMPLEDNADDALMLRARRENNNSNDVQEEQHLMHSYGFGGNSDIRKPVDFVQRVETVRQRGLSRLVLNEAPPVWRGSHGCSVARVDR